MEKTQQICKTSKSLIRAIKRSRIHQVRASIRYKYGFEVPKDYKDALRIDKENDNTKWQDAIDLELDQIKEYKVFQHLEPATWERAKLQNTPKNHEKIKIHLVLAVKHAGCHKAQLVPDGLLTRQPVDQSCFPEEPMPCDASLSVELWGTDIVNAYLCFVMLLSDLNFGEQTLGRHTLMHAPKQSCSWLLAQILMSSKHTFWLCTRHCMAQGVLVLAGMTDCLMSPKIRILCPPRQIPNPAKNESRYDYIAVYVWMI